MSGSAPTAEADDIHLRWMREAMNMVLPRLSLIVGSAVDDLLITQAEEAMAAKEVPVGCVFIRDNQLIARARNRTNELRNVRPPSQPIHPNTKRLHLNSRQRDTQN